MQLLIYMWKRLLKGSTVEKVCKKSKKAKEAKFDSEMLIVILSYDEQIINYVTQVIVVVRGLV